MIHTIGMLIPATNTAVEIDVNRVLPKNYQVFVGRLRVSSVDEAGWREHDADIDYQAQLLGTIKPAGIVLLQTAASFYGEEGYDAKVVRRISAISGAPAYTSAHAIGRAMKALGAKRIAMLSPYNSDLVARGRRYFETIHGLEFLAVDSFNMTDPLAITRLGPEAATTALAKLAKLKPDAIIMAGGAYHVMNSLAEWEQSFGVPIVATNQAAIWAAVQAVNGTESIPGYGRLLEEMPKG
jgi:maleate isomerase